MIRPAEINDAAILTEISFAAKRYWKYPLEYYRIWRSELTISPGYIKRNEVWVYREGRGSDARQKTLAFYSLVVLEDELEIAGVSLLSGHWLEHMFVSPSHIGRGIGTELFNHLRKRCRQKEKVISKLNILVDPNAKGFYQKMGCEYLQEYPSTIYGRTTPYFIFHPEPESR